MIRQRPAIEARKDLARVIWRIREVADALRPIFYSFSQDNAKRLSDPVKEK
ncbi:MAG: hypothetical protein HY787_03140 [Deltaproteobacteria bacterium]|nr:hypothetical protein [Deltaproteobacteria bacterium]